MFHRIYIEEAVCDHPRVRAILARHPEAERIACSRYGEVFNPKRQSFRLQKRMPALILAEKRGARVLPTPSEYGLGAEQHFYFSHMLNCLYDCRYCFLQGMYQSANYVFFVNFEDFQADLRETLARHPGERCFFFSGYDCDSLALNRLTGFAESFLPFFEQEPEAWLELRTKSVNIQPLLDRNSLPNVVTAFSLNPDPVAKALERKAPPLAARLSALRKLADAGWPIGLRFDPIVFFKDSIATYLSFLDQVFDNLPIDSLHSVSLGTFRAPKDIFKKMESLYPEEPLFMGNLELDQGRVGYAAALERELLSPLESTIVERVGSERFFPCSPTSPRRQSPR